MELWPLIRMYSAAVSTVCLKIDATHRYDDNLLLSQAQYRHLKHVL